jgi:hypothetical protein
MNYQTTNDANPRFDFIKMSHTVLESLAAELGGPVAGEALTVEDEIGLAVALRELGVFAGHAGRAEGPAWEEVYERVAALSGDKVRPGLRDEIARYVAHEELNTREELNAYSELPGDSSALFTLALEGRHAKPGAALAERCCGLGLLLVGVHKIEHHTSLNYNGEVRKDFINTLRDKCGLNVRRGYAQALYRDLEGLADALGDADEMRDE